MPCEGPHVTLTRAQAGRCTGGVPVVIYGQSLSAGTADVKEVILGGTVADVMLAASDGLSITATTRYSCGLTGHEGMVRASA